MDNLISGLVFKWSKKQDKHHFGCHLVFCHFRSNLEKVWFSNVRDSDPHFTLALMAFILFYYLHLLLLLLTLSVLLLLRYQVRICVWFQADFFSSLTLLHSDDQIVLSLFVAFSLVEACETRSAVLQVANYTFLIMFRTVWVF